MAQYNAYLIVMEGSLLSQTHFFGPLKALEAFDICVSSSTSHL